MYHDVVAKICKEYGKVYTKELQKQMLGGTDRHICEKVVKELKINVSVDEFESQLLRLSEKLLPQAPLQKGVQRLLFHLRDNKIPVALATNSTASQVRQHANAKPQIFNIFNHMVTATDPGVHRGKPFPDIYLAAARKFPNRPHPSECLVFEDSLVGLQAGLSAGMQVILTPHRKVDPEEVNQATMVLHNLLDFRPELFGLPPFKDEKPRAPPCPPPQECKPPPSEYDNCPPPQECKPPTSAQNKCPPSQECYPPSTPCDYCPPPQECYPPASAYGYCPPPQECQPPPSDKCPPSQEFKPPALKRCPPPPQECKPLETALKNCSPAEGFKPPPSACDPCSLCRKSPCSDLPQATCHKPFNLRSITENKTLLTTLLIGITSSIIYRLW